MREDDTLWSCDGYMIHNITTVLACTVGRGLLLALFRSRGRSRTWNLGRDINTAGCYDRVCSMIGFVVLVVLGLFVMRL